MRRSPPPLPQNTVQIEILNTGFMVLRVTYVIFKIYYSKHTGKIRSAEMEYQDISDLTCIYKNQSHQDNKVLQRKDSPAPSARKDGNRACAYAKKKK